MPIDTQWFTDRLAERRMSQRGLAKLMGIDNSAVSLMFRGKRKMTLEEAAQIAVLLQSSTEEVLRAAGTDVRAKSTAPVIGFIDGSATVVLTPEGTHDMVETPPGMPADTVVLQARTAGTRWSWVDGWMYFLSERQLTPDKAVDTFALVAIKNSGMQLRHVKRGYKRGTYNLTDWVGNTQLNVELAWASPVLWVKTTA